MAILVAILSWLFWFAVLFFWTEAFPEIRPMIKGFFLALFGFAGYFMTVCYIFRNDENTKTLFVIGGWLTPPFFLLVGCVFYGPSLMLSIIMYGIITYGALTPKGMGNQQ